MLMKVSKSELVNYSTLHVFYIGCYSISIDKHIYRVRRNWSESLLKLKLREMGKI